MDKGINSHVIKTLSELGLSDETELTPEQEQMLKDALDPEEARLSAILDMFKSSDD